MKHNDYEDFCKLLNDSIDNYRNRIQQLPRKDIYEKYNEIKTYEGIYDYLINEYTNYNIKFLYKENIMDFLYNKFQRTLYGLADDNLNDFLTDVIKEEMEIANKKSDVKYLIKGKLYSPILYGDEEDEANDDEVLSRSVHHHFCPNSMKSDTRFHEEDARRKKFVLSLDQKRT